MADPTSSDIKAQGPPSTGAAANQTMPQPIGVPYLVWNAATGQYERWGAVTPSTTQGMYAPQGGHGPESARTTGGPQFQLPRYYQGAELMPANWDPNRIADLQRTMVAAGLIPKTANLHIGRWDDVSQQGFAGLLAYANSSGLEWTDALKQYGMADQTNPTGQAPLTVRTSNPDDLRKVFRQTWIDTIGTGVDSATIDQMVAAYQGVEASAQQQAYNQAATGGTVADAPSAQTYAETQARAANPVGAQEHDALGFIGQFKQIIGGW